MHAQSTAKYANSVMQSCTIGMHLTPAKNGATTDLGIIWFRAGKVGEVSKKKKIHREKNRFSI